MRIPEDVSVIGIDGLSVSESVSPTLTTMIQPAEEMGRESVRILLDMLEGRKAPGICCCRHGCGRASVRPAEPE